MLHSQSPLPLQAQGSSRYVLQRDLVNCEPVGSSQPTQTMAPVPSAAHCVEQCPAMSLIHTGLLLFVSYINTEPVSSFPRQSKPYAGILFLKAS